MAAWNLEDYIRILDSWGLTDVLLPFALIFAILFAILQKAKIFGEDAKRINIVVSAVIGFMVVFPHVLGLYPAGWDVVEIMNDALPNVSLVIVAIVMALILIGLFGGEATWLGNRISGWIALISFLIIIYIFGASAGWWGDWVWWNNFLSEDAVAIIVITLVFGVLVWFITSEPKEKSEEDKGKFLRDIGEHFKPQ
ncbi:hypothetical protein D6764_04350 [Candidatus Woesearchaeota archaeon]|nr:MAG: hypothetical protein D6764_04350 [Candidatus Woesearchaeota archaeon]